MEIKGVYLQNDKGEKIYDNDGMNNVDDELLFKLKNQSFQSRW